MPGESARSPRVSICVFYPPEEDDERPSGSSGRRRIISLFCVSSGDSSALWVIIRAECVTPTRGIVWSQFELLIHVLE